VKHLTRQDQGLLAGLKGDPKNKFLPLPYLPNYTFPLFMLKGCLLRVLASGPKLSRKMMFSGNRLKETSLFY